MCKLYVFYLSWSKPVISWKLINWFKYQSSFFFGLNWQWEYREPKRGEKTVFKQLRNQGKQTGESKIVRYRIFEMLINRTNDTVLATLTVEKGASMLYGGVISSLRCERSRNGAIRGALVRAVRYTRDTMGGGTTKNCKKITVQKPSRNERY